MNCHVERALPVFYCTEGNQHNRLHSTECKYLIRHKIKVHNQTAFRWFAVTPQNWHKPCRQHSPHSITPPDPVTVRGSGFSLFLIPSPICVWHLFINMVWFNVSCLRITSFLSGVSLRITAGLCHANPLIPATLLPGLDQNMHTQGHLPLCWLVGPLDTCFMRTVPKM